MKKYIYLFLIGILLFELTFYISLKYFDLKNEKFAESEVEKVNNLKKAKDVINSEKVLETDYQEEKIGLNTKLIIKEKYKECEHFKENEVKPDTKMINLTKDEFEKKYPKYNVEKFSKDKVVVEEEKEGICDEHYKILMGEDFIEVFKLNEQQEEELYLVTNISRDYLAKDDIQKLNKGIEVYRKRKYKFKVRRL